MRTNKHTNLIEVLRETMKQVERTAGIESEDDLAELLHRKMREEQTAEQAAEEVEDDG